MRLNQSLPIKFSSAGFGIYFGPKTDSSLFVDDPEEGDFLVLEEDLLFVADSLAFCEVVSFLTSFMNSLHPQKDSADRLRATMIIFFKTVNPGWISIRPGPCRS